MVDQRLREPELPAAGAAASPSPSGDVVGGGSGAPAVARPLKDVAPVETVWLGLAELDIFTLRRIPEPDADPAYLGGAGTLVGATDLDRLRAWLSLREPNDLSDLPGWDDLGDADDVDLQPYEDAVLEIAELGDLFTADLDRAGAEQLVGAWVALAELAQWGGWTDVLAELEADRPVGYVLSGVLPEVSAGDSRGRRRLQELDLDEVQECWAAIVALVESRVRLVD